MGKAVNRTVNATLTLRNWLIGFDNRLFISKYQLELPRKEELERFLQAKRREITEG